MAPSAKRRHVAMTVIARQPDRITRRHLAAVAFVAFLLLGLQGPEADGAAFKIVSRGRPQAEIILDQNNPASPLPFAARELQRYVKKMSGAELPIVPRPTGSRPILLVAGPLPEKQGRRPDSDDPRELDRYRLRVEARELRIEGASERAVLYGVYDLLERLGCGWCVPGDDSIPARETLELAAQELEARPAFAQRMMLDFPMMSIAQTVAIADWLAKNRMNWIHECPNAHGEPTAWYERRERVIPELTRRGLSLAVGGHTMHTWLPETNSVSHPDWFAWDNGERKPPTLCLSQPEMTAVLIRNIQHFLDRCPEVGMVDLWHTDSEVFCHCARCTHGVLPDGTDPARVPADAVRSAYVITYVEFVNRVAQALDTSHPRVLLGPLIYSQTDHGMPDGCPALADNVWLGLAHFFRDSYRPLIGEPKSAVNLRFLGNDLTWMAKAKRSYVYEYYNGWTAPYLYPGAQVIVRDLQTLQALGVEGISSDMYGYTPINLYVAARALWSPDISWTAAVQDFCRRYYGDVGGPMAENELQLERGIFGLNGYQGNGARDPESPTRPASGRYLEEQRPHQIQFLKTMIAQTKDPQVRVRLERALLPWVAWSKDPRFWAFPPFTETRQP